MKMKMKINDHDNGIMVVIIMFHHYIRALVEVILVTMMPSGMPKIS